MNGLQACIHKHVNNSLFIVIWCDLCSQIKLTIACKFKYLSIQKWRQVSVLDNTNVLLTTSDFKKDLYLQTCEYKILNHS